MQFLISLVLIVLLSFGLGQFGVQAQEPYLGEIRMFAMGFAPKGWALCNGQILSINQNAALFSILGTTYGGDGQNNFALPDLRGRAPIHQGQGLGLSNRVMGERSGSETVTVTQSQMPAHIHLANAVANTVATQTSPANNFWGKPTLLKPYSTGSPDTTMNSGTVGATGGSQPHENMHPYLVGLLAPFKVLQPF